VPSGRIAIDPCCDGFYKMAHGPGRTVTRARW
jgi:hypothetical protein